MSNQDNCSVHREKTICLTRKIKDSNKIVFTKVRKFQRTSNSDIAYFKKIYFIFSVSHSLCLELLYYRLGAPSIYVVEDLWFIMKLLPITVFNYTIFNFCISINE